MQGESQHPGGGGPTGNGNLRHGQCRGLPRSQEMLAAVLEAAPAGIVVAGADGRVLLTNAAVEQILGGPLTGDAHRPAGRYTVHRPDGSELSSGELPLSLALAGKTSKEVELVIRREDGTEKPVLTNAGPLRSGDLFEGAVLVMQDISRRKHVEEELRESEEKFRSVFEQAAVGIGRARVDDARWIDVNEAFCRMLGYTREEMLQTPWLQLMHPEDLNVDQASFSRLAKGELESYTVEKRFLHKQGHTVWARLVLSLVRDAAGRPSYEIAVIENISAEKRAMEQLREEDIRKDEFLAMLSHELRNPLAPIRNGLHVLELAPAGSEKAARALAIMDRQVNHLTRLVDDLLDVTRITKGRIELQCEELNLEETARQAAEDMRETFRSRRVQLHVDLPPTPILVFADRARMVQVISNLLDNAAKFSRENASCRLTARIEDEQAILEVRDEGVGMEPEVVEKVFEPFFQARDGRFGGAGGLGLGLAVVRGLVHLHGGEIAAHSEGRGRGAVFAVRLPVHRPEAKAAAPCAPSSSVSTLARRVLVIEDNEDAAESLKEVLDLLGHSVELAFDGFEGIDKALSGKPDVVLCDIGLPEADGYAVARALRAAPALNSTTLIALSGFATPEDVERSQSAGFDHHMAKPPRLETLTRLIESPR